MQPYFFPYIGYFQLIHSCDLFVIYDNIKYTKKGWINRNRFLQNGADAVFSLPLRKDSDSLDVRERAIASDFNSKKLLGQIAGAYRQAPYFADTIGLLERTIGHSDDNLFRFIHHALVETCAHLGLKTEIRISSDIEIDHELKAQDKVLAICTALDATTYINTMGGVGLYDRQDFLARGIDLKFLQPRPLEYPQLGAPFVPWLSIIDVMMFNPRDTLLAHLESNYDLIDPPQTV